MGCQPRYEVTSLRFVEDKDSGLEQNSDSYLEVGKLFMPTTPRWPLPMTM